jgi:rhodanese-related sulfurtransferase
MDPRQAEELIGKALFLDVREAYEFQAGHIDGSVHIPLLDLPERFEELGRDKPVVVVCQIGQRSDLAARFLRERGFDAHNLEGGVARWTAENRPIAGDGGGGQVVDGWARNPEW